MQQFLIIHILDFETKMINLKELRDQMIGHRYKNGLVVSWGIVNDGRIGVKKLKIKKDVLQQSSYQTDEEEEEDVHTLRASKPVILHISETLMIIKIACGNSHTLALTQLEGHVFSWGLNNSGCLGYVTDKP
jgi:alpha-tubulin suppressor-like RCC1 family protein